MLRVLPQRVVLRRGDVDGTLVEMLAREVVQDLPGQEAVLDRLLDLLLISCLRTWLSRDDAPGWYRADADPVVGAALRLVHHDPARAGPSTRSRGRSGCRAPRSRAASRRSSASRRWATSPAGAWTWPPTSSSEPDATLASVARAVGYATPFALSAAFKRVRGVSPAAHRARAGAA